jgi:hypothetical protein
MSDMQTAYRVAALAVRQRFAEQHPEELEVLNRVRREDVAVYSGTYDHVENVLKCLEVPVTMNPDPEALKARIIFLNCSGNYGRRQTDLLGRQVEEGKWLVSSDWALGQFLEHVFPNTVRWTRRATGDEVISAEPYQDSIWSEVVVLGADPQWWLEGSSQTIEVLDTERVRVEAASHDLLVRYDAPVVAVRFDWGLGHVFHVISHFWHQRSRTPTERYRGPCTDFLKAGMRLSDEGIERVLRDAKVAPEAVNFAMIQSAATATELVAQLCVRAKDSSRRDEGGGSGCGREGGQAGVKTV